MTEKRSRLQCLRNLSLLPALSVLICIPGHARQNAVPIPPPSLAPAVKPLLVGYVPAYNGASLAAHRSRPLAHHAPQHRLRKST